MKELAKPNVLLAKKRKAVGSGCQRNEMITTSNQGNAFSSGNLLVLGLDGNDDDEVDDHNKRPARVTGLPTSLNVHENGPVGEALIKEVIILDDDEEEAEGGAEELLLLKMVLTAEEILKPLPFFCMGKHCYLVTCCNQSSNLDSEMVTHASTARQSTFGVGPGMRTKSPSRSWITSGAMQ